MAVIETPLPFGIKCFDWKVLCYSLVSFALDLWRAELPNGAGTTQYSMSVRAAPAVPWTYVSNVFA